MHGHTRDTNGRTDRQKNGRMDEMTYTDGINRRTDEQTSGGTYEPTNGTNWMNGRSETDGHTDKRTDRRLVGQTKKRTNVYRTDKRKDDRT